MRKVIAASLLAVAGLVAGCAGRVSPYAQPASNVLSTTPSPPPTCPSRLTVGPNGDPRPPTHHGPAGTMVPASPSGAVACRYEGLNDPKPSWLAKSATLDATQAARLATAFNGAQPWHRGVPYSCPADFGTYDLVLFTYSDGGEVDVLLSTSGCRGAGNGNREVMMAETALDQLDGYVGMSLPPT